MSGHSKWHNIKLRKASQDAKKAASFTKVLRQVSIAAQKGSDPSSNFALAMALDAAKSAGVPKDTIERAVQHGSGADKEGVHMQEVMYEGFGTAHSALLIITVTDNTNRALTEIKTVLSKFGGSFAGSNAVSWMFEKKGIMVLSGDEMKKIKDREQFELNLMDAGATDLHDDGDYIVETIPHHFAKLLTTIKTFSLSPTFAGFVWEAKEKKELTPDERATLAMLLEKLEMLDDVSEIFTNAQ